MFGGGGKYGKGGRVKAMVRIRGKMLSTRFFRTVFLTALENQEGSGPFPSLHGKMGEKVQSPKGGSTYTVLTRRS